MRRLLALVALLALALAPRPVHAALQPVAPGWSAVRIADGLYQPHKGIAIDPVSHDAFVLDLTPAGSTLYRITLAGGRTVLANGRFEPDLIAFDPAARVLYLSEYGGLLRFDEFGAPLGGIAGQVGTLALGTDGALYGGTQGGVLRRDPATGTWQSWRSFEPQFATLSPSALALDASGNVFAQLSGWVCRIEAGATVRLGGLLLELGMSCTSSRLLSGPFGFDALGPDTPTGVGLPWVSSDNATGMVSGVATDPEGRIYVTASGPAPGAGSVWVISPAGIVPARPSSWGAIKSRYR